MSLIKTTDEEQKVFKNQITKRFSQFQTAEMDIKDKAFSIIDKGIIQKNQEASEHSQDEQE